jgi:hypothetical protein
MVSPLAVVFDTVDVVAFFAFMVHSDAKTILSFLAVPH